MLEYCRNLKQSLEAQSYLGEPIRVEFDDRDIRGGEKTWSWVRRSPIRIEVGPRDMEKDAVFYARRDKVVKTKSAKTQKPSFLKSLHFLKTSKANYIRRPRIFQKVIPKSSIAKKTLSLILAKKMQAMPQLASVSIAN